jgi:hypothetical protein
MHKNATKCNKTQSKWCINKHGASKIIDTLETYQLAQLGFRQDLANIVDWSLHAVLLRFFLAFHHDDDADDPLGCYHVE